MSAVSLVAESKASKAILCMHEQSTNYIFLKKIVLDVVRSHPLRRTRFGQYQASYVFMTQLKWKLIGAASQGQQESTNSLKPGTLPTPFLMSSLGTRLSLFTLGGLNFREFAVLCGTYNCRIWLAHISVYFMGSLQKLHMLETNTTG